MTPFDQAGQSMMGQGPQMPGGQSSPEGMPPPQPASNLNPEQAQQPQMGPSEDYSGGDDDQTDLMDFALSEANLAKKFKNKKEDDGTNTLEKMASELTAAIEDDDRSRQGWIDANEEWLKLALLIRENKTYPWPKASNVKYPLIATAAMQFSARAYPALVPNDGQVVKCKTSAVDLQGTYEKAAIRVAKHMSYQAMCEIPDWEENMDKLLMTIPVSGVCFKKTFHDSLNDCHQSTLVYPENLIVNYHAKTLESAYRKTEVLYYTENEIKERVNNNEAFLDIDYGDPKNVSSEDPKKIKVVELTEGKVDKSTPHAFYACHTYWDLDDDGYEEPYIITIHRNTQQVVKITARWDSDGVQKGPKGKILKIKPVEYFTDFPFIPNPDGSIYGMGFGMLLGPLNESVNTLINQLVDAGTLNNLSGGFIGKNLRIKMGQLQVRPGEWKVVNGTGEDLSKSFYPLPTKEPSTVLYQLLEMLVQSGNQLASIAEIFVGKMPGQNTPATTTQETIQQGMAVFTAIYKRVYRSLGKEFKKLFRLNRITPGILKEEMTIAGEQLQQSDYDGTEHLVIPGADPSGDSATVRLMKLQQVGQLISLQTINPMVYTQRFLEANEIPNAQELLMQPQPQQDPKAQALQQKAQIDQQKAQSDMAAKQQELQMKERLAELDMQVKQMEMKFKEQELALKIQGDQQEMDMNQVAQVNEIQHTERKAQLDQQVAATKAQSDIATNEAMNKQSIQHGEQQHQQKMKQTKETQAAKPKEKNASKQK